MEFFWGALVAVFIAELGDKTQFLMIAMASKYKTRDIICGVTIAILLLNFIAVCLGAVVGGILPAGIISVCAGLAFFFFAYSSISSLGNDIEDGGEKKIGNALIGVFATFFIAELGDKTQLATLAEAANAVSEGIAFSKLMSVFCASCIGLFAADLIGLVLGVFLGKTLPTSFFSGLSFVIFSVFGVVKLVDGFSIAFGDARIFTVISCLALTLTFLIFSYLKGKRIYVRKKEAHTARNKRISTY